MNAEGTMIATCLGAAVGSILLIPLTYSITTGIGAGLVAWAICKAAGRRSELNGAAAALALVFLLYLCF